MAKVFERRETIATLTNYTIMNGSKPVWNSIFQESNCEGTKLKYYSLHGNGTKMFNAFNITYLLSK